MSKNSKAVLCILFAAVFVMLGFCMVQVNTTQQGILELTGYLANEAAGNTLPPASDAGLSVQVSQSPASTPKPVPSSAPEHAATADEPVVATQGTANTPGPAADVVEDIVYWVPDGGVWHTSQSCRTLSRSKTILSGTVEESGKPRACHVCG